MLHLRIASICRADCPQTADCLTTRHERRRILVAVPAPVPDSPLSDPSPRSTRAYVRGAWGCVQL